MPVLKPGNVIFRTSHEHDGHVKDRWFVVGGVFQHSFKSYYILFYCTSSELLFPDAHFSCNQNKQHNYSCFKVASTPGGFEKDTLISFMETSRYSSEIEVAVIDAELRVQDVEIKFSLDRKTTLAVLKCASNSVYLSQRIIKRLVHEIEELEFPF